MIRVPTHRQPTHPGEMLLEDFLTPMVITQRELADAIQVPYQRVNEIVNGKRGITPSTALRLAKFFGMTPDFWMNLQLRWDLYHAQQDEQPILDHIATRPLANTPVDVAAFEAEAKRILAEVEAECGWMCETWHPHCDH